MPKTAIDRIKRLSRRGQVYAHHTLVADSELHWSQTSFSTKPQQGDLVVIYTKDFPIITSIQKSGDTLLLEGLGVKVNSQMMKPRRPLTDDHLIPKQHMRWVRWEMNVDGHLATKLFRLFVPLSPNALKKI